MTPHGRGDAVLHSDEHGCDVFTLPCEERMPFSAFLRALDASLDPAADSVPYVSAQDGSLSRDFPALAADVPAVLPWVRASGRHIAADLRVLTQAPYS